MSLVMSRSHALVTRLRGATSLVHDRSIARCTPTDRVSKNARRGDLRRWQSTTKSVDERLPRVIAQTTVFENPWLRLKAIRFLDERGAERQWTGLERTTTYPDGHAIGQESKCDAVVVFPFLTQPDAPTRVILIRQFRPPVGKWVVELPAGLIDGEEAPDVAASRELQEETGYVASRVLHMGPPMVNDQGITNGSCRFVLMQVEADAQASAEPTQQLEADEMIQVLVAPLESLVPWLLERQHTHGDAIDARLYSLDSIPLSIAWCSLQAELHSCVEVNDAVLVLAMPQDRGVYAQEWGMLRDDAAVLELFRVVALALFLPRFGFVSGLLAHASVSSKEIASRRLELVVLLHSFNTLLLFFDAFFHDMHAVVAMRHAVASRCAGSVMMGEPHFLVDPIVPTTVHVEASAIHTGCVWMHVALTRRTRAKALHGTLGVILTALGVVREHGMCLTHALEELGFLVSPPVTSGCSVLANLKYACLISFDDAVTE